MANFVEKQKNMDRNSKERQQYPVGQQDFRILREEGFVYVDKTMFIDTLISHKMQYLFLARPRRFGKSLFLSTLRYFFEGRRELFKGLHIDSTDWKWEEFPVLYLDLNTNRFTEKESLEHLLDNRFREWEEIYDVAEPSHDYGQRFRTIIKAAHEKTGRKVVILVDEYDKPLVSNLNREEHFDHFRGKLSSIYSNFKSSAEHLRFVFITGVSRFSKLSVFSDLNNLQDITFADEFAEICGITEKELAEYFSGGIHKLADKMKVSYNEAALMLKQNYDGYRFTAEGSDIYNPWSILNAMAFSKIGMYWNQTGKPTIVVEALHNAQVDLDHILNMECDADMLAGLDLKNANPLALLYQTGYLTIKDYDPETDSYRLGMPNREVTRGLLNELLPYYVNTERRNPDLLVADIIRDMRRGEPVKMMESIDIFLAGIPYDMKMEDENNFHNALYILLRLIGAQVETEVHTSDGRIDIVVKTSKFIYIMELKFGKTPETALTQIEEKEYHLPYRRDPRRLFCIGANFNTDTRHLDKPDIREVEK